MPLQTPMNHRITLANRLVIEKKKFFYRVIYAEKKCIFDVFFMNISKYFAM
jgi:hypothetical protein